MPPGLVKAACRCFENVVSVVDGGRGLLVQLRGQKVPGLSDTGMFVKAAPSDILRAMEAQRK